MIFCNIYDLSLYFSVRAFLPSLRVLETSHVREEIIKMVSATREISVVSMLIVNLWYFLLNL
ncbi:hypothetical protein CU303_01670 [Prochlorococcus marinus str. MU1417]|nr:hypothetical protein [Prochlorococcus marinus str. MU1417]